MASKENQYALDRLFCIAKGFYKTGEHLYTYEEEDRKATLQQAIDRLELKDKALDILEHSKLFIGYKTKNGKTIRELLLDKARKELENGK